MEPKIKMLQQHFTLPISFEAYHPHINKEGGKTFIMGFGVEGMLRMIPELIVTQAKKDNYKEVAYLCEEYVKFKIASMLGIKSLPINLEEKKE